MKKDKKEFKANVSAYEHGYNDAKIEIMNSVLEVLKSSKTAIKWYMDNGNPSDNPTDFFNVGANQLEHIDYILDALESPKETKKLYTIEDLKNGLCCIKNDSTLKDMNKVMNAAFNRYLTPNLIGHLYFAKGKIEHSLVAYHTLPDLPSQSARDFLFCISTNG